MEEDHRLTETRKEILEEMEECEKLDKILLYLDNNRSTFPDMKEVCEKCEIDYNRSYALRLENDGLIENIAKNKDGDGFKISKEGENFINVEKGYCAELKSTIEETQVSKREPIESIHIQAENVIYNKDSNVGKQSQKVDEDKTPKNKLIQIIVWVIGIAAGLTTIYKFFIE
jgi:hypothetical protein